jgi:hypothetical protein
MSKTLRQKFPAYYFFFLFHVGLLKYNSHSHTQALAPPKSLANLIIFSCYFSLMGVELFQIYTMEHM